MSELEHSIAIYFDSNSVRREIDAADLSNLELLAKVKLQKLYDKTEQKRLYARVGADIRPHFCELSDGSSKRALFEGERDPAHNKRVDDILTKLRKVSKLELVIVHKVTDKVADFEHLFSLHDYEWGAEVHRVLEANTIVRNDIYGQRLELAMSVNRPWVAIEVINTHYPDEQAFSALLNASERYPLIVLFDFTAHPNSFVKVDVPTSTLRIRPSSFYIKDGAVWNRNRQTEIKSSALLKLQFEKMLADWAASRSRPLASLPRAQN